MVKELDKYTWDQLADEYPYVNELLCQPAAIKDFIEFYSSSAGRDALYAARQDWETHRFSGVILAGMGSSMFACRVLDMVLCNSGIQVSHYDAGELLYYRSGQISCYSNPLYIFMSQSGESIEIVKLLSKIPESRPGSIIWGITNTEESTLATGVPRCFFLHAGPESSVTSKTFCNSLLLAYLLGNVLVAGSEGEVDGVVESLAAGVDDLVKELDHLLDKPTIAIGDRIAGFIGKDAKFIQLVARGASLATAEQVALNIKEMDKIPAEAMSGGQFRHGPVEMVTKDARVLLLASDDATREISEGQAYDVAHRFGGGKIVYVSNKRCDKLEGDPRILPVIHNIVDPFLAPIIEFVICQLFMVRFACVNRIEPGVFRYVTKITKEG
jgi:glucosamine--fructose-6-phosphate aminotransferase (isomerizing)